eukprot:8318808-Pyramimonas_sp.AAC.1
MCERKWYEEPMREKRNGGELGKKVGEIDDSDMRVAQTIRNCRGTPWTTPRTSEHPPGQPPWTALL